MTTETLANMFPSLSEDEFQALKSSIEQVGLQQPILIRDGEVLDGRHRLRACDELGITPLKEDVSHLPEKEIIQIVMARNIMRRHLTAGQRAALAAALQTMSENLPNASAAKQAGVSTSYVKTAKKIKEESPETFEKLSKGEISMPEAKEQIKEKNLAEAAADTLSAEEAQEMADVCVLGLEGEFKEAYLDGKVLATTEDRGRFMALSKDDRMAIEPGLLEGYSLTQCVKYLHMEVTEKTTLSDLRKKLDIAGTSGQSFSIEGLKVMVTKQ